MVDLTMKLTTKDAARLLGVTPRRVRQLADEGVLRRCEHGGYRLDALVAGWTLHLRRLADEAQQATPLSNEQQRLVAAQANLRELEFAKARGDVLSRDAVSRALTEVLAVLTNAIQALGGRLAADFTGKTAAQAKVVIDAESRRLLETVHDGLDHLVHGVWAKRARGKS